MGAGISLMFFVEAQIPAVFPIGGRRRGPAQGLRSQPKCIKCLLYVLASTLRSAISLCHLRNICRHNPHPSGFNKLCRTGHRCGVQNRHAQARDNISACFVRTRCARAFSLPARGSPLSVQNKVMICHGWCACDIFRVLYSGRDKRLRRKHLHSRTCRLHLR